MDAGDLPRTRRNSNSAFHSPSQLMLLLFIKIKIKIKKAPQYTKIIISYRTYTTSKEMKIKLCWFRIALSMYIMTKKKI